MRQRFYNLINLINLTLCLVGQLWSGGVSECWGDGKKSNAPALQRSITPAYITQCTRFHSQYQLAMAYRGPQ